LFPVRKQWLDKNNDRFFTVAFTDGGEETGFSRPWLFLLSEFAIGTTVHGLKFIAEPSKFLCRK